MKLPLVWFNKYLSNTWEIISALNRSRRPNEFRILCTHPWNHYRGRNCSDLFEREPTGLRKHQYVDYCLDVVRRHGVSLFLPRRNLLAILRAHSRLEALGARIIAAADAAIVALVDDKAKVYAALRNEEVHLPVYAVVNDLAEFDAAWERLRPTQQLLCYKPSVSVYGLGFHIIADAGHGIKQSADGKPSIISLKEARSR